MTIQQTALDTYGVFLVGWLAWALYRRVPATMKWQLVWYVPTSAIVLALSVFSLFAVISNTLAVIGYLGRPSIGLLLSPNAWTWMAAGVIPAVYPWVVIVGLPPMFEADSDFFRKKSAGVAVSFAALAVVFCGARVLAWGTYPITHSGSSVFIRDWPFIPWPSYPLL